MKEFTIERAGFKFEFRATEEVNRDRRLRIGYKVANGPKHSNNTMPGTDGYFNAEYHDGIIYFWGLKLKGKKLDGLRLNDEALQKELDDMIDRAVAAEKAKEEAEIQALRDGTVKIELRYHDGEYLDGYQVYGHAADLLVSLGLAKWVDGWGYYVDHRAVETLGKEFTYQEAAEYARPALDAKNEELRKRAEKQAAREAERATMTVKIIEQGTTQGDSVPAKIPADIERNQDVDGQPEAQKQFGPARAERMMNDG